MGLPPGGGAIHAIARRRTPWPSLKGILQDGAASGGWRMEDGGWRMVDGGWRMEEGGWRKAAGGWRSEDVGSWTWVDAG